MLLAKRLLGQDAKMKDADDDPLRCDIKPKCYSGCYECTFEDNCDNHCALKKNCNRFLKQQVEITSKWNHNCILLIAKWTYH